MLRRLRNLFYRISLDNHAYSFLFGPGPPDEAVVLDCETTGLNTWRDEIIALAAIRVRGQRILTSEAYQAVIRPDKAPTAASIKVHQLRPQEVASGRGMHEVLPELLRFIGGRPIVGYYIDFDVTMLDRYVLRFIGSKLPNPPIEVSEIYYELKYRNAPPGTRHDLRFAAIAADLGLPPLEQHDAFNDALLTAMMYVQLRDMRRRGARIGGKTEVRTLLPVGA